MVTMALQDENVLQIHMALSGFFEQSTLAKVVPHRLKITKRQDFVAIDIQN